MAVVCIIYGKSGAGKSRSIKGFGPDDVTVVKALEKEFPFRNTFNYITQTDDLRKIAGVILKAKTNAVVVDDFGYTMVNAWMREHSKKGSGSSVFDTYNNIADTVWAFMDFITDNSKVPRDRIVYLTMLEDKNDAGETRLATIGRILDEKAPLAGRVTIVLRAVVKDGQHVFITNTEGSDIAKSPEGMFADAVIPNDLAAVDKAIRDYWGLKALTDRPAPEAKPNEKETK